ncbi:hypothetical protein NUW54_g4013 [Trametes sanguinea]|uniref:Uncharacterized protein n=1 Tax=Trametes sanguinea TaxID=158606 RepID=A0ACC1Q296_9APHY|nr:hypothetical protein NUW54_g4013 [Trametes sanguinea]
MSASKNDSIPAILFTNDSALMTIADHRSRYDASAWVPSRVTIAALTPTTFGLLINTVIRDNAQADSVEDDSMFPVVIEPETLVLMDEVSAHLAAFVPISSISQSLLCATFPDTGAWPLFKIRFQQSDDYWSFAQAFAKAKLEARPRGAEIVRAFRLVLDIVSGKAKGNDDSGMAVPGGSGA